MIAGQLSRVPPAAGRRLVAAAVALLLTLVGGLAR